MKKTLLFCCFGLIPSYIFALAGFGIQVGSDLTKLGSYTHSEGEGIATVTVNSYEKVFRF